MDALFDFPAPAQILASIVALALVAVSGGFALAKIAEWSIAS